MPSASLRRVACFLLALAATLPAAAFGQLSVTNYSYTVSPSSSYPDTAPPTKLTNGTTTVVVWPNTADSAALVGWNQVNPGIQFNFTDGQSVSEVKVWAANSKGSAGVALPQTITITSGSYSKTLTVTPPAGDGTTVPLTITGLSAAATSFTITAARADVWTMLSEVQFFGTGAKANNTGALNLASSWTGGQAPVSTDVVLFNSTFTSTTPLDTGAAVNWAGLKVTGGSGTLTIDPTTTANRLGIGTSGIDLSGATRDVRLTDLRLTGGTAQPWSIASGRSLTVGADSLAQDAGANPTLNGAGTLVKEGGATALTLGSLTSFTGTLSVQAGSVATSAANQLTGGYTVSLAAGATLQLGANDTLPTNMNSGTGTIEILQSNALTITNSTSRTVDRVFSGTGSLTKTGTGTLTLSGNNTFSGGLVVNGGASNASTVVAGSNTAFGSGTVTVNGSTAGTGSTLDVNGATLANAIVLSNKNTGISSLGALQNTNTSTAAVLNGTVQIGGENYVGGDGDITFNGVVGGGLSNSYSLFKQGAGTWTFANEANTFDGFYYQIGGVTAVTKLANAGEASSLGQVSAGQNLFVFGFGGSGGGTLRYAGSAASTSDRAFSLRGSTAAANNTIEAAGASAAATLTLTGGLSAGASGTYTARLAGANAGVNEYAGVIANGSGTVALEKSGSTTWALTGTNTYSGGTTISAGTLSVGDGGTSGTLGGGSVSVASGATLGFDRTDAGLTVSNAISGSGVVEQRGSGTTALTGSNTYTGPTTVSAGTLSLGSGSTGGSLSATTAISIASGATFAVNRSNAVSLSNTISGAGGLAKLGTGNLTLSGTNTFAGGTSLSAGTLTVTTNTALGSGPVSFATAGATLNIASDISNAIAVTANGTLAAGATNVELSGNFSGSGTLTKTGTGTLTLSGPASTFTGDLVISGGAGANSIVKAGSANAFGSGTIEILGTGGNGSTFDLNGFSLDNGLVIGLGNAGVSGIGALQNSDAGSPAVLNGAVSLGGEIYVGGAGDITFNGLVSGGVNPANAYSLYKDGAGTWSFTNTANSFDGFYYQIDGATEVTSLANLNQPSALGQPTDANRNRFVFGIGGTGGGTLRFNGSAASTSDRVFALQGSTAAADNSIEAAGTSAAATLTLTGGLSATRSGSYTARLAGSNAGVNEYAGVIANGSGTLSLLKEGTTTWALSAANTYTGTTTVAGGRLAVNGSIGAGAVTVSGGTLGGSGSIAGTVAVQAGGTLAPGNSIESLSAGTTSFAGGATFAYEVDSSAALGVAADLLRVNGDLNLSTDANDLSLLSFVDIAGTPAAFTDFTTVFAMINYTGAWNTGLFSYNGAALADGSRFSVGSQLWEIDYNYTYNTANPTTTRPLNFQDDYAPASGTQTFVTITAVPEPATLGLLAAAVAGLALVRRARCPSPLSGTRHRATR